MSRWIPHVRFVFAWYDLWIGVYVDTEYRRLFVFPVPMFGVVLAWPKRIAFKTTIAVASVVLKRGLPGVDYPNPPPTSGA